MQISTLSKLVTAAHTYPRKAFQTVGIIVFLVFPLSAFAVPILNPSPANYADDDGSTLFLPNGATFYFEAFDPLAMLGLTSSFGFYRASDPSEMVTLFDSADDTGGVTQIAAVNFDFGVVLDVDSGVMEDSFTAGISEIGFFLEVDGHFTLYSEPDLNGGTDHMASFRSLFDPSSYFLAFLVPDGPPGVDESVYLTLTNGTPTAPIPAPSSTILMTLGLLMLATSRRRRVV